MRKNQILSVLGDLLHHRLLLQEAEVVFLCPELSHLALGSVRYVRTKERKKKSSNLTGLLSAIRSVLLLNRRVLKLP